MDAGEEVNKRMLMAPNTSHPAYTGNRLTLSSLLKSNR